MMRICFYLCLSFLISVFAVEYPQVKISDGVLNGGFLVSKNNRKFSGFQGIPFAKPPLGELRFQAPVPNDPWKGEKNATGVHAECPQRDIFVRSTDITGEEDCLYLNVYTPKVSNFKNELLPVMVYFHGGGFLCGSGDSTRYGPDILLDNDIVLVTTNYRLGALGFLATGDEIVPGNNGLKDQSLALKWVKKNIENFGGDPDKITLFGESAGGASSNYHMISPLSRGLFHNAILQSGTSMCDWVISKGDETIRNTHKLARALNCPTESSQNMIECLRKIDARYFIELDEMFKFWDYDPMIPFKPVVEPESTKNPFLPDEPINLIKSGKSMDIPIIVGLTKEEGGLKTAGFESLGLWDEFAERFNEIVPVSLLYNRTENNPARITQKLKDFYIGGKKIQDSHDGVLDLYTDAWIFKCSDDLARLHAKYYKQPVYFYLFGYRGSSSFSTIFGGGSEDFGTVHVDDLLYLFPLSDALFPDVTRTENDKKMTKILNTLWTNFAKTGNPTPTTTDLIPTKWKPFTVKDESYLKIDNTGLKMKNHVFKYRAKFWRSLNDPLEEIKEEL